MAIFTDDAPHVAGTVITLTILGYLTFGLRVYVRTTRTAWGAEDWMMTVATVPFLVLSIACLTSSFFGIGIHDFRFKEPGNEKYIKDGLFWFFLFEVFYCVTIIPIKLSISWMLVRIAKNRKPYIWTQYIIMAMFTLMNLIAAFYIIFQCDPVATAWDDSLRNVGGKCQPPEYLADIYYATTAVNIVTDWSTALMPIPLLRSVQMNNNTKMSVAFILGLGIFASLSACIRLKYTVNLTNGEDYHFGLANIVIWGYAENGTGLIVGNMSTLRPLFRRMLNLSGSGDDSTPRSRGLAGRFTGGGGSKFEPAYELGPHGGRQDEYGAYITSTEMGRPGKGRRGGDAKSSLDHSDDGDSAKEILQGTTAPGTSAILVSRAVTVSRS